MDFFTPPLTDSRLPLDSQNGKSAVDPHLLVLKGFLMLMTTQYLTIALLFPVVGVFGGLTDPDFRDFEFGWMVGGFGGGIVGFVLAAIGLIQLISLVGLARRRPWGWGLSILALCLNGLMCLGPVSMYGLWALFRENVRHDHGITFEI